MVFKTELGWSLRLGRETTNETSILVQARGASYRNVGRSDIETIGLCGKRDTLVAEYKLGKHDRTLCPRAVPADYQLHWKLGASLLD